MNSPVHPSASTPARHRKTSVWLLSIAAILVIGFIIFAIYSYSLYDKSPKLVEGVHNQESRIEFYQLSEDQASIVAEYGYPDSFTIMFYTEEFDPYYDGQVRDEVWRYYEVATEYDFYNGDLMYTVPITDPPDSWVDLPYHPDQFTALAALPTVLATASITDFYELPVEKELVKDAKLYYTPGLTFGTVKGRLIYVETVMVKEGD